MRAPVAILTLPALLLTMLVIQACEQAAPGTSREAGPASSSAWIRDSVSSHVVLTDEAVGELSAAIERAQATASEARKQFEGAMPHEQLRFVVLWMAPTSEGSREFVWVRPLAWSPFRIEGIMLSEPTAMLESGAVAGDLVSFPIEALADWVILDPRKPGHAIKGATTLSAIEQRIGKPEDQPRRHGGTEAE